MDTISQCRGIFSQNKEKEIKMKLEENHKLVIIIDADLPLGLIANTASVLSLSIGKLVEGIIGEDLYDKEGRNHLGITTIPIPILKTDKENIKNIRKKLFNEDVIVIDFCDAAQTTKNYADYRQKIKYTDDLVYLGIAVIGNKKIVNKYSGNMPLLR